MLQHESILHSLLRLNNILWGLPDGSGGKESTWNVGDLGSIAGLGRSAGGGHGNPLQDPCLGNPQGLRNWQTTVRGVTQNPTGLSVCTAQQYSDMDMLHFDAHSQLMGIWLVSIFWLLMNHELLCNVIISYCVFSFLLSMYKYRSGIPGSCSNSKACGTAQWSSRVTAPLYTCSSDV